MCTSQQTKNSDEDKNIFQEQILSEHARFPKQETNVQGVVAAKANKIEQTSDNGLRLINVALGNNLVIKSTQSEKKVIYKSSWLYPDGKSSNQIYHVLIERKHQRSVTNITSMREAD